MLFGITHSFPWLFRTLGHVTTRYSPFRRFGGSLIPSCQLSAISRQPEMRDPFSLDLHA
jgi:hypothetical protein